ncbi:unnamed protein product [Adineta ricciae]|uniref:Uncharacterized protein n=1 Tax=Adineta ricciae TaxID=249248 RepID=A0A814KJ92_ADIRI|nr:unnamed protein product [Adineta ricciae]
MNIKPTTSMCSKNSNDIEIVRESGASSIKATGYQRFDLHKNHLIWLDESICDDNEDCYYTTAHLRSIACDLKSYSNVDECVLFIETMKDRKVYIIISGSLGQKVVPQIHDMSQIDTIFIFCGIEQRHKEWTREWSKVKGIFTEIMPICKSLKLATQRRQQNAISMSFIMSDEQTNQLNLNFIDTCMLKVVLATIPFGDADVLDYVNYCRDLFVDNEEELNNVEQVKCKYRQETAIWWYSRRNFLYYMLNHGIRLLDCDTLVRMGFLINDLHRQIEQLHKDQKSKEIFTVYHGQGLSKKEFKQLNKSKGGLMSFNSFLFTSKVREVSLRFARDNANDPDLIGILFVMKIIPKHSSAIFASIGDINTVSDEDEVIFSMHSVFRIEEIKAIDENETLFEVSLTLTDDKDLEFSRIMKCVQTESYQGSTGWFRLGLLLTDMGQMDKAEEIYKRLIDQETEESKKASIYHQLGWNKYNQKNYPEAILYYRKALEILEKILQPHHPKLATSYNNIGIVYGQLGDYSNARLSHEKALAIWKRTLLADDPSFGAYHNNIGLMYYNMGDYPNALSSYKKASDIWERSLPKDHPDRAMSYNNIGLSYENMGKYRKARSYYERAIKTVERSLPSNHPWTKQWKIDLERVKAKT